MKVADLCAEAVPTRPWKIPTLQKLASFHGAVTEAASVVFLFAVSGMRDGDLRCVFGAWLGRGLNFGFAVLENLKLLGLDDVSVSLGVWESLELGFEVWKLDWKLLG